MGRQSGFTLIELITVIVILGILAAVALPRFTSMEDQARTAAVEGLAGGLRSAASLARASWLAGGSVGTTVSMDGVTVQLTANGWPTADDTGIEVAMQDFTGFTHDDAGTFSLDTDCHAQYSDANGTVAVVDTGC